MLKVAKIAFYTIVLAGFFIIAIIWLRANDLFVLNRVNVVGNRLLTSEEIIDLADLDFSKEIFDIDVDAVRERLLSNELIKSVKITRYRPSAIKIKVTEKDLIAVSAGSRLNTVTSDGLIVDTDNFRAIYDLPMITGSHFIYDSLGQKIVSDDMWDMVYILNIIRTLDLQLYHSISEINFNYDSGVILFFGDRPLPIILGFDDYMDKIYNLYIFYAHMRNSDELNRIKAIDARFAGQIITQ
ncbi:FtsQ-type POTRA domain-containing protein [candidate division KSB1 bacterium]|nr:FtsQ-type POTRA domain-containing protein [candidate division KSB1 bacterium]